MKRTLLQVVQEYLDTTSGFYVDSIYDNDESQQVAKLAERVYYKMVQEFPNVLFTMKEMTLDSLSDTARPNYMLLPESIQKIQESQVYYNTSKTSTISYKRITYLPPLKFIDMTSRSGGLNTIVVEGFDGNKMSVFTNQFPSYCTSFDNKYVVFDAYNSTYDTTLQSSKSKIVASGEEVFFQEDDFIIPVPSHLSEAYLDMFLNEALTLIYQQPIGMIASRARSAKIKLQQDNRTLGSSRGKKNYGRNGILGSYVPRGHGYE
jgi:hypothetical protein